VRFADEECLGTIENVSMNGSEWFFSPDLSSGSPHRGRRRYETTGSIPRARSLRGDSRRGMDGRRPVRPTIAAEESSSRPDIRSDCTAVGARTSTLPKDLQACPRPRAASHLRRFLPYSAHISPPPRLTNLLQSFCTPLTQLFERCGLLAPGSHAPGRRAGPTVDKEAAMKTQSDAPFPWSFL